MDFLYGLAFNLLFKLLFDKPEVQYVVVPPPRPAQTLKIETSKLFHIPEWVTCPPKHCFVGISKPCQSIEEARQQALRSAVSQILQALGANYTLTHNSTLSGNADCSHHELEERLTYTARWFVSSVQQRIRESDIQQFKGNYIYFVLVNFPATEIERLRKLTIGPKVAARVITEADDHVVIEARENNGVGITLTDYEIEITSRNRHAGIITMFAWKVPESSCMSSEGVFHRKITLNGDSQTVTIPSPTPDRDLTSVILGSKNQLKIVLHGYDEIGRPLSLPVNKF